MRNVFACLLVLGIIGMFGGCTSREKSPEQIRENTAKATSKIKENTVAVAQGVKEGLTKPNAVDLNSASKAQLTSLPGVDGSIADRIVAARPYDNPDQLVSKRVLSNAQYDQVKDRVAVRK